MFRLTPGSAHKKAPFWQISPPDLPTSTGITSPATVDAKAIVAPALCAM